MRCHLCAQPHEIGPDFYATLSHIKVLDNPPNRPISEEDINNMVMREREAPGFFSSLPAIHLMLGFQGNNELWLLDGQDRYVAAGDLKRENIKAILHPWMDALSITRFRFRANENGRGNDRQERIAHGVFLVRDCGMSLRDAAREVRLNNDEGEGGGEVALHRAIKKLESGQNGGGSKPLTIDSATFKLLTPVQRLYNLVTQSRKGHDEAVSALSDHLINNPGFIVYLANLENVMADAVQMAIDSLPDDQWQDIKRRIEAER